MGERIFALPDLGEGLEDGRIVTWLVAAGDEVALNQPLVEVETAKAVVEIPSPFAGVVTILHASEGVDLPVGAPLVTFDVADDNPLDEGVVGERPTTTTTTSASEGQDVRSEVAQVQVSGGPATSTPPVRKLARDLGVDIGSVVGTGPGGRVMEADVRAAVGGVRATRIELDHVRREVAANLSAVAAIPQVTTFRTVDCSTLQAYREELGVSPLPVLIAALCATVPGHPLVNARWGEDHIDLHHDVDVGVAVDTERGLVVPVVRDAGARGIADVAAQIRRLAEAARSGRLALDDIRPGPTIAVSNTGSYGSEAGTPLLTPGCAVTLAFGVIQPRALVVDGEVVARPAATLSLTFDHRVLDGAAAGRALTDLVDRLQSPDLLRDLPR